MGQILANPARAVQTHKQVRKTGNAVSRLKRIFNAAARQNTQCLRHLLTRQFHRHFTNGAAQGISIGKNARPVDMNPCMRVGKVNTADHRTAASARPEHVAHLIGLTPVLQNRIFHLFVNGRTAAHSACLVPVFLLSIAHNAPCMVFHLNGKNTAWANHHRVDLCAPLSFC